MNNFPVDYSEIIVEVKPRQLKLEEALLERDWPTARALSRAMATDYAVLARLLEHQHGGG